MGRRRPSCTITVAAGGRRVGQGRVRRHVVVAVAPGIDRLNTFLRDPASGEPRLTLASACGALLHEFGRYRYHEVQDGRPISELPIDRDNHAIKALAYWLYDRFGPVARPRRTYRPFVIAE